MCFGEEEKGKDREDIENSVIKLRSVQVFGYVQGMVWKRCSYTIELIKKRVPTIQACVEGVGQILLHIILSKLNCMVYSLS